MANEKNLKHFTKENAKEMGRRGGIASGKTRRKNAALVCFFETWLEMEEKGTLHPSWKIEIDTKKLRYRKITLKREGSTRKRSVSEARETKDV